MKFKLSFVNLLMMFAFSLLFGQVGLASSCDLKNGEGSYASSATTGFACLQDAMTIAAYLQALGSPGEVGVFFTNIKNRPDGSRVQKAISGVCYSNTCKGLVTRIIYFSDGTFRREVAVSF